MKKLLRFGLAWNAPEEHLLQDWGSLRRERKLVKLMAKTQKGGQLTCPYQSLSLGSKLTPMVIMIWQDKDLRNEVINNVQGNLYFGALFG